MDSCTLVFDCLPLHLFVQLGARADDPGSLHGTLSPSLNEMTTSSYDAKYAAMKMVWKLFIVGFHSS